MKAYAKLNLNLHILPDLKFKKETGYYPIQFINCELDLHDNLYIKNQKKKITFTCDNKELSNTENLAYKAAYLLKKEINSTGLGAKIVLQKKIPVKAGLGGGSSDAAATIKTLLKLWKVTISSTQLAKIIDLLGSDVFYFMQGGLCEVSGKGEFISRLTSYPPKLWIVLVTPDISKPSTSWMYKNIDQNNIGLHLYKYKQLKQRIINRERKKIFNLLHNDFEDLVNKQYPELLEVKKDISDSGSVKELIAGSGLSIVGFYRSKQSSLKAFQTLQVKYRNILWTHTK